MKTQDFVKSPESIPKLEATYKVINPNQFGIDVGTVVYWDDIFFCFRVEKGGMKFNIRCDDVEFFEYRIMK